MCVANLNREHIFNTQIITTNTSEMVCKKSKRENGIKLLKVYISCNNEIRGIKDGVTRRYLPPKMPQNSGKKYCLGKYCVKFGHFVIFSYIFLGAKYTAPQSWLSSYAYE